MNHKKENTNDQWGSFFRFCPIISLSSCNNGIYSMEPILDVSLKEIIEKIVNAYRPERVILFGSHAYGEPGADSDVDLLVIMESDERPIKREAMISKLLRPRPFPMDILVRTPQELKQRLEINDPFYQQVLSKGVLLYERESV